MVPSGTGENASNAPTLPEPTSGSNSAEGIRTNQRRLPWKLAIQLALEVSQALGAAKEVLDFEVIALTSAAAKAGAGVPTYLDRSWLELHNNSQPGSDFERAIQNIAAAWDRADFGAELGDAIFSAGSWPAEVARRCGCTLAQLQFWMRHPGVTGLDRQTARALDECLHSGGRLLASHACCDQDGAHEPERPLKDSLAGGMSFGRWLQEMRTQKGFSPHQLQEALKTQFKVKLTPGELNQYELDYFVPSQKKRPVIEAIDTVLGLDGALTAAWVAQQPQRPLPKSSLPASEWPAVLRQELDELLAHTRGRKRHSWHDTQVEMFEQFCAGFFGYLVTEQIVPASDLTVGALCDWSLVERYWLWRRDRNGRTDFTTLEQTRTRTILALYRDYFPNQWKPMTGTAFWRGRLPEAAVPLGQGPVGRPKIRLDCEREKWCHVVATAAAAARTFLRSNKFVGMPRNQRAEGILGLGLHMVTTHLQTRAGKLPPLILSRKAALRCRRLLVVGLLLARPMLKIRALTLLKLEHVHMLKNGLVALAVPGELLNHRVLRKGVCGVLPESWDWLHDVANLWITQARPFLLAGTTVQPLGLFCEAPSGRELEDDGELEDDAEARARKGLATSLYRDCVHLLGVNPDSIRFLVAQDGNYLKQSSHDLAHLLGTSRGNVARMLGQLKDVSAVEKANETSVKLTTRGKKTP
jgi:transcriptional regulator with XRE-family HTH domain